MDAGAFVLDGSVTLVWGFDDEDDDYAAAILDRMADLQAYVPSLWPLEVADALLVGERRRRTTPADAARFLAILGAFPIAVDDETVGRACGPTRCTWPVPTTSPPTTPPIWSCRSGVACPWPRSTTG
jgi:hypothetical protein